MKLILIVLMACFSLTLRAATTPEEAYSLAQAGKAVIVDVREAEEVKQGMIKDAKWFPMSKMTADKEWKKDFVKLVDGKKIFLYCRTGNRSGKVQVILKENGLHSENLGGFETLKDQLPTNQ